MSAMHEANQPASAIRHATPADIPKLIELGWKAFPVTNSPVTPSPKKWQATIEMMILRPWEFCVLVGDKGFLLGQIADLPYADASYAMDLAFFSEGGDGLAFLNAFEAWAKSKGAVQVVITNSSGNERTDQFLEQVGYTLVNERYARTL